MTGKERAMRTTSLAVLWVFATGTAALAASVNVSDKSTTVPGVAAAVTAMLLDAGAKPQNAGSGVLTLEIKNFHCDQSNNGALDASNVHAGLPALKCRINAQNNRDAAAGQVFAEGRAMVDALQKIENSSTGNGPAFTDCAMGYCGIFAKAIKCTIDTKIDNYTDGGRWACDFTDGQ
jgi:hypothetical protein